MNRLNGVCLEWFPNGVMKARINYEDGIRSGLAKWWNREAQAVNIAIYIRGVPVTTYMAELIRTGRMTVSDILNTRNAEVRRVCLEEFGYGRFLSKMPHRVIDTDEDSELVLIHWHKSEEPICLVKVKCSTTGVFYTLRVPPDMKTVKQAVAWTFDVKPEKYVPEKET